MLIDKVLIGSCQTLNDSIGCSESEPLILNIVDPLGTNGGEMQRKAEPLNTGEGSSVSEELVGAANTFLSVRRMTCRKGVLTKARNQFRTAPIKTRVQGCLEKPLPKLEKFRCRRNQVFLV
jgi:hypothetical protein